jgi:hypothetical protein
MPNANLCRIQLFKAEIRCLRQATDLVSFCEKLDPEINCLKGLLGRLDDDGVIALKCDELQHAKATQDKSVRVMDGS